jgi:protein SCO1
MNPVVALLGLALALQPGPSIGIGEMPQRADETPAELEGVGVTERLGDRLPTDLTFRTHEGKTVTLGQVLAHDKPTILTFNYSDCPMLCSVQLNGLVDTLREMEWTLGQQYDVLTVSIDPKEQPDRAELTRERYLGQYKREPAAGAWNFLVGDEVSVRRLADSVGFGYRLNPENGEWLHTAALILLSGDETISRYLYGIQYSPKTTQLSLTEASEGKLGSPMDQIVLYCFAYDPNAGTYTPVVANIMRLGGAVTVVLLGGFVLATVLRSRRKKRTDSSPPELDDHSIDDHSIDERALDEHEPDRTLT